MPLNLYVLNRITTLKYINKSLHTLFRDFVHSITYNNFNSKRTLAQQKTTQKTNLINGAYTVSEASHIINSALKVKINFHKLNNLSITEGNNKDEYACDNEKITKLMNELQIAKEFLYNAIIHDKKLIIKCMI